MALRFLDHPGEMAALIRDHDWPATPLGPIVGWPATLRTTLGLCLGSAVPTAIYWGPDLRLLYNDAWTPIPADRHPACLGQPAAEVWQDIWHVVGPQFAHVLATGEGFAAYDQPLTFVREGQPVDTFFNYSISAIRDEAGEIVGIFNQGNETTRIIEAERRVAAEAERLRESEERLQLALDSSLSIGTWDWDVRADRVTADARFARLYGVDPAVAAAGASIETFFGGIHPDDLPRVQVAIAATLTQGAPFIEEYRLVQPHGRIVWVVAQGRARFDAEGRAERFPGISFDITTRRMAEDAAREAAGELRAATEAQAFVHRLAERLRALDSATAILEASTSALGRRLTVDRCGFYRLASPDVAQFLACWHSERLPPLTGTMPTAEFGTGNLERYRAGETMASDDYNRDASFAGTRIGRLSGAGIGVPLLRGGHWAACLYVNHATPRHWLPEDYSLIESVAEITWDAVERATASAALRDSEAKFRAITNSIDQMVWSALPDGYHDYYNQRWYDFTGVPQGSTDGEAWNGVFHPDDQPRAWAAWDHSLATGDPYRIEYRLRHHSGAYRWVLGSALPVRDDAGTIVRWFGTCTDIQELVEAREVLTRSRADLEAAIAERTEQLMAAEAQLRQAQKMEAVGQLTGGIAHDFNNMLAVVIGALDLLERRLARGQTDVARYVEAARDGATRAAALTQRLLAFSRRSALDATAIDVGALVAGMSELLSRTLGEAIQVETRLSDDLWPAHSDRGQVENAILNLSVNARDAMPRGGRLAIEVHNRAIDENAAAGFEIAPGDYVSIAVIDSGTGMDADIAARAFDPFFTTKAVGKGTGLGLSQVFGFARQSGGHVAIESAPGTGTTVRILLPRDVSGQAPAPALAAQPTVPRARDGETILVVEDEDRVRHYSIEALGELGYGVIDAADGASALRLIARGERVDLLFTDVVMPEMTGRELAEAARRHLPQLRVLYTSGYTRDVSEHVGPVAAGVLTKPFDVATLAHRVRDALDGDDAAR